MTGMSPVLAGLQLRQDGSPVRILLVDDSVAFLDSASDFLSSNPNVEIVGQARSADEALERAARLRPDLVLMDLAMPGVSGLEATRRIKALSNAPMVVILTLHDNVEYRTAARAVGADGFVAKSEFGAQLPSLIDGLFPRKTNRA